MKLLLINTTTLSICLIAIVCFFGCKNTSDDDLQLPPLPAPESLNILHIAHTRSNVAGEIPSVLFDIDYSNYDQLCHGGDVDVNTSSLESTLANWNALFHFDTISTHLSMGNHDDTDRELLSQFTNRPSFYVHSSRGITYLILDTQLDSSRITGEQLELVNAVCDTISESGALIILTHKLLWMADDGDLQTMINDVVNYIFGNCDSCTQPNNFHVDVYPRLLEVLNREISVFCIAGDIGDQVKEFEHQTDDGIYFLASGIDARDSIGNKALLLEYTPSLKEMTWTFENLENL